ncbi:hypothetical protein HS088_TW07G00251 [Tripterygium wilfordii]|uniref:Lysosomal Pro-X carboxypeptidase n=1 Tax=Tripterygium wilfordii TaxID=458696 RepID=A0A7J7DEG0_TRIWF|nr:hypothetical protein HS088_TW07G00251 [Tripterygium wilfordii]
MCQVTRSGEVARATTKNRTGQNSWKHRCLESVEEFIAYIRTTGQRNMNKGGTQFIPTWIRLRIRRQKERWRQTRWNFQVEKITTSLAVLASWFRLKYPHIALGALASSAPILYFDDITPQNAFALVVSNDFKEVSRDCYETIKQSWSKINEIAATPNGLSLLSKRFKTCRDLRHSSELKSYLSIVYTNAAKDSWPRVKMICQKIDETPTKDDILDKIYATVVAVSGEAKCYVNPPQSDSYSSKAWNWQRCSEVVMPRGYGDETMFEAAPYNENNFINMCKRRYGVGARPRWVTTYYGGHDIKLILKRFGSNIIFSNGLKDPFSAGGVLKDISDTIRVVKADYGTHCQDLLPIKDTDPDWLVAMRKEEFQIIKQWIDQYYEDLKSYNQVVTKKEKNI